jgi:hypothetical protein
MLKKCPVDGILLPWQPWSNCSNECGNAVRKRVRVCTEPQFGGELCKGKLTEREMCQLSPCAGEDIPNFKKIIANFISTKKLIIQYYLLYPLNKLSVYASNSQGKPNYLCAQILTEWPKQDPSH